MPIQEGGDITSRTSPFSKLQKRRGRETERKRFVREKNRERLFGQLVLRFLLNRKHFSFKDTTLRLAVFDFILCLFSLTDMSVSWSRKNSLGLPNKMKAKSSLFLMSLNALAGKRQVTFPKGDKQVCVSLIAPLIQSIFCH